MTHFYRFNWNAICHSLTLSRDILNVTPYLWGDPAPSHPSQPTTVTTSMQRLRSPELKRPLLDHSGLSVKWHSARKKTLRGAAVLVFCVCPHPASLSFRKTEKKILFYLRGFPLHALTWKTGFVSFMAPYIFISICHVMALRQDVQSGVDGANDNVSQRYVPC